MIGYLKGTVSHLFADSCFIDVQGVGYRAYIPLSTRQQLTVGTPAVLYTYMNVRDDALLLFGFASQEEYNVFVQLISVSGIGPKVACGMLSTVAPRDLQLAIAQNNIGVLTRIPGIGKKTAERLILELKDKVGIISGLAGDTGAAQNLTATNACSTVAEQAMQALLSLGYSQSELTPVFRKILAQDKQEDLTVEIMIKLALKDFGLK